MRLAPLSGNLSIEASLGRDLKAVQSQIVNAKAELSKLRGATVVDDLQVALDDALGPQLSSCNGVLGKPSVSQVLESKSSAWQRNPMVNEILVINSTTASVHACRPVVCAVGDNGLDEYKISQGSAVASTWCGWVFSRAPQAHLVLWDATDESQSSNLCRKCFGTGERKQTSVLSSSSDGVSSD